MIRRSTFFACLYALMLGACRYVPDAVNPVVYFTAPTMPLPTGGVVTPPPQDTPELEARARAERESIDPPPPITRVGYPNLGTVPAKPVMPTPADIIAARTDLALEQSTGARVIAEQAQAPIPQTLPKPGAVPTAPVVAPPATPQASDTPAGNTLPSSLMEQPPQPFLSGAVPLQGSAALANGDDPQIFLPTSEMEQTDALFKTGKPTPTSP